MIKMLIRPVQIALSRPVGNSKVEESVKMDRADDLDRAVTPEACDVIAIDRLRRAMEKAR